MGFTMDELDAMTWGQVMDVLTESDNDRYNYPKKGTTEDYKKLMGID